MRDTRLYSLLLLVLSIFFCLCLAFLIWNFNNRTAGTNAQPANANTPVKSGPALLVGNTRDSLQNLYNATVNYLDAQLGSGTDSLGKGLAEKSNDFERLKAEIAALLKERGPNGDLELARQKIAELQLKVAQLYSRNQDVEAENKRLSALLAQMATGSRPAEGQPRQEGPASAPPAKKPAAFTATDLRLQAVYEAGSNEEETNLAEDAEKLNGSFMVKGGPAQPGAATVQVVVTQPNGQVLKNSAWESGAFETAEGRKVYSYQLRYDPARSDTKQLRFSLGSDRFMQGNYTMQLYCNGQVIGRLTKTLL
jgi:hypothetical protein